MSKKLKILKVIISIALLILLGFRLDWPEVMENARSLVWWALPLAVGLQMLVFALGNWRWWAVMRTHQLGYRFSQLLPQYFIGCFFSNFLPTTTGGDLFRMYYIYRQKHGAALAVSPVMIERVIGLAVLFGIAVVASMVVPKDHPIILALSQVVPPVFGVMLVVFIVIGANPTYWAARRFFERWQHFRLVAAGLRVMDTVHSYLQQPYLILQLVILTLLLQLLEILLFYAVGSGVGATIPFAAYMLAVPMLFVAASLPVTVGGLGVREVAAVALFTAAGMSESQAGIVALVFIPVLLIASLPGLVAFIRMKDHKKIYQDATHTDFEES